MYLDPSGESLIGFALLAICVPLVLMAFYATNPSLHHKPVVLDISRNFNLFEIFYIKGGLSVVINFDEKYIEFYPHLGGGVGSSGTTASIGVISNYEEEGDYKKWFSYYEGGYYIGLDHCYAPKGEYENAVQATSFTFSSGFNFGRGYDYYFYFEELTIDWS